MIYYFSFYANAFFFCRSLGVPLEPHTMYIPIIKNITRALCLLVTIVIFENTVEHSDTHFTLVLSTLRTLQHIATLKLIKIICIFFNGFFLFYFFHSFALLLIIMIVICIIFIIYLWILYYISWLAISRVNWLSNLTERLQTFVLKSHCIPSDHLIIEMTKQ